LSLRRSIGPFIAYSVYFIKVYFLKNRKRPKVFSIEETLKTVKKDNLSVIRFGDGEMSLIDSQNLAFQEKNDVLSTKLKSIVQSKDPGLMICIPGIWENLSGMNKKDFWFAIHHQFRYAQMWNNSIHLDKTYGNAFITRPYLIFKDKSKSSETFKKIMSLWENQDIVIIEGSKSRMGVGNNLFENTKSISRILCPPENAFSKYETIRSEAVKISKDKLILLSIGPTAKVLAYDLFLLGHRVLDLGHLDMEYEMFLRHESKIVKVEYKYFNEIEERNPIECTDPAYLSQILAKIE